MKVVAKNLVTTEKAVKMLLESLGVDLSDPNFADTPHRVAKMYAHFFRDESDQAVEDIMTRVFPSTNDQLVIVRDIECFGMCPHHLLPIVYKVDIGYIPKGKVLGLSKLARLAIALSAYPKLQEDFTKDIADAMELYLAPGGVMVVVDGLHGCMRCRGVEMNASTITSDVRGLLRMVDSARNEFLTLAERRKA